MKRIWMVLVALCLACPAGAAEGEQLYLVGRLGPAGSLSGAGLDQTVAYLRWGVVEGGLPADLEAFVLLKDGDEVFRRPVGGVLAAAEIDRLYGLPEHARRRAALQAALAGDPRPLDGPTLGATVSARLRAAATDDGLRMWARTMARQDIVLAHAWGRAFIDPEPARGAAVYRLEGVGPRGATVRLGEITLTAERRWDVPAPEGLRQVVELDRCDAPEAARTHGVVALDWDHPGRGGAERFANGLMVAGYDVYRATEPEAQPVERDLRALAAEGRVDAQGRPVLRGLERVNTVPIVVAGRPDEGPDGLAREAQRTGWNPAFAQWTETAAEVLAAGMRPGDRRTYHVVPLDVTGQYGDTATLVVTVPDTRRPPAPFGAEVVYAEGNQRDATATLVWPALNPANYHAAHADGRTWCNLDTAAVDGVLRFAPAGRSCAQAQAVALSPREYVVYRFDDAVAAAQFADSDGDGVADAAEQTSARGPDGERLILPGLACDPARQPPNAEPAPRFTLRADAAERVAGRLRMAFVDDVPARERGAVFWYRIAARGVNGRMGPLGPPVRAMFPRTDKPAQPSPDQFVLNHCPAYAYQLPRATPGAFALDRTGLAARARMSCRIPGQGIEPPGLATRREDLGGGLARLIPLGERDLVREGDVRVARSDGLLCDLVADAGQCDAWYVEYLDDDGQRLAAVQIDQPLDPDTGACRFTAMLDRDCAERTEPVDPETVVVDGPVVLTAEPRPATCVEVMLRLGGEGYRLDTVCPDQWPWTFQASGLGDDLLCLGVAAVDADADRSTEWPLPCVQTASAAAPRAPRLRGLAFDPAGGDQADLRWFSAEQPGLGILAEWWAQGAPPDQRLSGYFDQEGRGGRDAPHTAPVGLTPLGDTPQVWCVRARTVGLGAGDAGGRVSAWSSTWCGERPVPGQPLPEYLPWPAEAPVPALPDLPARVVAPDGLMAVYLGRPGRSVWPAGACTVDDQAPLQTCEGDADCAGPRAWVAEDCELCARIRAALGDHAQVVVYRQHRSGPGAAPSDFVQVSPLIEGAFCERSCAFRQIDCNLPNQAGQGPGCGVDDNRCVERFFDPYLRVLAFPEGDPWPERSLVFLDRSPFQVGRQYRYQLVYFDAFGELRARRDTGWLTVGEGL